MSLQTLELLEAEIAKLEGPIVVFGAGGFIGSSLFKRLLLSRDDCYGVTHRAATPHRLLDCPADKVLRADLLDPPSLEKLFCERPFRTIFNLSTYGGFAYQDQTRQIFETNILGPANLVNAALAHGGFSAFVQGGSSSEYGLNSKAPKETDELQPNSDYAVSKIASAYYVKFLGQTRGLPAVQLRYYSVYGPGEAPDRLISQLLLKAKDGLYPPLVNPEISRDYVYIDDAVEATILGASRGCQSAAGASINIASGRKTTIKDLVGLVKELASVPGEPAWGTMPDRGWDVQDWYGDPSFAKDVLGWSATMPLRDGLDQQRRWMADHPPVAESVAQPLAQTTVRRDKLSAVIACYMDGLAIPYMHERLTKVFQQLDVDYEIIFVNDGSPDDTRAVLEQITDADHHVIAVEHSRNFSSQAALVSGSGIATGDAVIWLEGDLQDTPETIPEFYAKWKEGYEVVYGIRDKREGNQFLIFFYRLFYRVFKRLSYISIPLDAGDFSLLDRKVVKQLLALPEKEQFLRGLRAWVGFKQTGVHYYRPERMFGVSTNNWRKNIGWAKKGIFSFSFVPLEILSYAGTALTLVSFLALIGQIIAKLLMPDIPHGISTIIVLILFFGGLNLLGISVLGEYLGKVLEETKSRPKFIRRLIRHKGQQYETDLETFQLPE